MSGDYNVISGSPINKSPSKQLYSFSKSIRFSPTRQPWCNQSFYDGKRSAFGKRTTTLGYGNRTNFANQDVVPPVGNYSLSDSFSENKNKGRGYGFSKNKKTSVLVNPEKSRLIPGPGAYNHMKTRNVDKFATLNYSMSKRLDDPLSKHQNELGPGQYETIPSITNSGKYFVSKYQSSGCGIIGKSRRASMASRIGTPGPGTYRNEAKASLNSTGIYFNSKFKNMEASKFSRSIRPGLEDKKPVPGPGSYHNFSQFAQLNKPWSRTFTAGRS